MLSEKQYGQRKCTKPLCASWNSCGAASESEKDYIRSTSAAQQSQGLSELKVRATGLEASGRTSIVVQHERMISTRGG